MKRPPFSGLPSVLAVALLATLPALCRGDTGAAATADGASRPNPLRKVLTMLTMMDKKVRDEGQKEQVSFDKYMCFCHDNSAVLQQEIDEAEQRIPQLESTIQEAKSLVSQLEQELEKHRKERDEAKATLQQATDIRNKENADFLSDKADSEANIKALGVAIQALQAGVAGPDGSFLQKPTADTLRKLAGAPEMTGAEREAIESFLDQGASLRYSPASSEILGMLKQMQDNMAQELTDSISAEAKAAQEFEVMRTAKTTEIAAAENAIEDKSARVALTNIDIVNNEQDLDEVTAALENNKKFLAELTKNCKTRQAEWIEHQELRKQELQALADTTRILNEGDTLNVLKDTLPTPVSFVQVQAHRAFGKKEAREAALKILRAARTAGGKLPWKLNLLALAIGGRKVGFESIIKMIDDMLALKAKEQQVDAEKKTYCRAELDKTTIKSNELTQVIADKATMIEEKSAKITGFKEEIEELVEGIKELDKAVAEQTDARKAEHAEAIDTLASNNAAIQLLEIARSRLQAFYGKAQGGETLTQLEENDAVAQAASNLDDGAPDAPESPKGAAKENGNAVEALINKLTAELKSEMDTIQKEDKTSQLDYEEFLSMAKDKRAADAKSIAEKEGVAAGLEAGLHKLRGERKKRMTENAALEKYVTILHTDCDTLLGHFDEWSAARTSEVGALNRAKQILSGV